MDVEDYVLHEWVTPPAEVEPDVRHTLDEIFNEDLSAVSGDRDLTASWLDTIQAPLETLRAMGLQLVGVLTSGKLTLPASTFGSDAEKTMPWRRVHYIVAPEPAYYRLTNEEPARVHKLGVDCEGIRLFTRSEGEAVAVYGSLQAVERDFERAVPWCERCALEALADGLA